MYYIHQIKNVIIYNSAWKQNIMYNIIINIQRHKNINKNIFKSFCKEFKEQENISKPLRTIKPKANSDTEKNIVDLKKV